jgi:hypothetical protein
LHGTTHEGLGVFWTVGGYVLRGRFTVVMRWLSLQRVSYSWSNWRWFSVHKIVYHRGCFCLLRGS